MRRREDRLVSGESLSRTTTMLVCTLCILTGEETCDVLEERIARQMLSHESTSAFLGADMARCRKAFGLSRRKLGELIGVSPQQIGEWESADKLTHDLRALVRESLMLLEWWDR